MQRFTISQRRWMVAFISLALVLAGIFGARWAFSRPEPGSDAETTKPRVGFNRDPTLRGEWVVIFPDGLVVALSEPYERYPNVGAPSLAVTAVNYGRKPVEIGPKNFLILSDGKAREFSDGDPSFGTAPIPPREFRHGNLTYYGFYNRQKVERLAVVHGSDRVSIDLAADYPTIPSVVQTLQELRQRGRGGR